jgi:hypothetical protein
MAFVNARKFRCEFHQLKQINPSLKVLHSWPRHQPISRLQQYSPSCWNELWCIFPKINNPQMIPLKRECPLLICLASLFLRYLPLFVGVIIGGWICHFLLKSFWHWNTFSWFFPALLLKRIYRSTCFCF